MPLKKGTAKRTISSNISEFHKGKTYQRTKNKFGVKKADAQAVAASLNAAGRSSRKKRKRVGKKK